jgi:hypothetical protein
MGTFPPAIDQYFKDLEQKVQSWFDKIKDMAKKQGIPEGYWIYYRLCYY